MTLNNYFTIPTHDLDDRPKPKVWLLKPDYTRIERLSGVSKLNGTFKANNLNTLTGQISPTIFDSVTHKQKRNTVFDLIKNKYLIEFHYNGFKDYFVIDEVKNVSTDSDNITFSAESVSTELSKKAANELEMLGSTIRNIMSKTCEAYAPLWSVDYVDAKLATVKRELTLTNSTVMGIIDEVNKQFDSVVIFNNKDRKMSFYHKDNVGVNRGLRIRENSYLKSFEDTIASKDIITRLYPFGNSGLTIQSVNPSGTDYIEDFSYFMAPFKRDAQRKVLQHSDYMSDELCHALLDYEEFYNGKKDIAEEFTKRYSDILKEYTQEAFTLNQLTATFQRLQDRVEMLKPKSEYIELGTYRGNFNFYTPKSSYYLLMIENKGNLAKIKFGGQVYDVPTNDWLYIKIDTGNFKDATKFEDKLKYTVETISSNVELRAILTRSSKTDFEEDDDKDNKNLEQKYNYPKYQALVADQTKVVNAIEKRMKQYEDEKSSLIKSMNPKLFLSDELYKERESYVFSGIWTEENHTEPKDLFEDAQKEMKKQKELNRSVTVGLVNFTQSLEHKRDWDKLNVGDVIVFSNKIFNKKLKAYITDIQMNFEDNQVTLTISDIYDYVDESKKVAELIATASSTSTTVNFHKEQIKKQQGKMTAMTQLIEAEWDANKKRIMAGNETVDIGAHGIKVVSNNNPDEYVAIVGGVIALTRDGGNTFKTGVTPEGVNAETLIGKIFIGENLELQNESGSVRFNKDGFFADVSSFTLTTNNGEEDYFDKLKREMQEDSQSQIERVKQSLEMKINKVSDEAGDVQNVVDGAINNFQEAFKDGIISNVESKMIRETLAQLEKENNEYIAEIDKALENAYISSEDIVELTDKKESYESMYTILVEDINKSIADKKITAEESELINQAIVNFREGIQEVLASLKEILARTLDTQIRHSTQKAIKYADRMKNDIKDELSDLKKAMDKANKTIEDAMKDNVFDAVEIENIKTMLMILKSEQEDVINRYTSVYADPHLSATLKSSLKLKKEFLTTKYNEYTAYVNDMIKDGKSDDTERVNYQLKYKNLTDAQTDFFKEYDNAVIAISKAYTDTREGQLNANIDGLRTEFNNDLKDIKDNMSELTTTINDTFKDGIITSTELNRLTMHLDMLDREYLDVEERYKEIITNEYLPDTQKNNLGAKRSPYTAAHSDLRQSISNVIEDGIVNSEEKTSINKKLSTYNTSFAAYTTAIQSALNTISRNAASDIADEKVKSFNPVLESLSTNLTAIQKQVDSAIDTYYYGYDPTLSNVPSSAWTDNKTKEQHVGDLFLNTKTGIAYRFLKSGSTYQWQRIEDQAISDALNRAQGAMDLADNKRRVFVATPKPPYDVGDLWMQGTSGDAMVCFTAKTASQTYASADWIKAVKYTDDSKANAVLSELNAFKSTTNTDITNLKSQTDLFKKDIYDAFDDKVISMSEASAIKSRFYQISDVKKRLENKYFTLIANPDLIGNPKANLTTQYNNLLTKYNTLESTINSAISDNKINSTESKNTNTAFDNFVTAIKNIEKAFDDAFTAIITNIATSKAQAVQDRFDTWKNSEFTTTSEGIVQRVSEANWKDKYFPQIDSKIDGLEIGGRNLLEDSLSYNKLMGETSSTAYTQLWYINISSIKNKVSVGDTITISFDLQMQIGEKFSIYDSIRHDTLSIGRKDVTKVGKNKFKFIYTTKLASISSNNTDWYIYAYNDNNANDKFSIANIKIEKGNKATDWTPAPEDIDNQIGGRNLVLDNYKKYTNYSKYGMSYDLSEELIVGRKYTVSLKGSLLDGNNFSAYVDNGYTKLCDLTFNKATGVWQGTGVATNSSKGMTKYLSIFDVPKENSHMCTIEWIKLEEGTKATDWSPTPENIDSHINSIQIGGRNLLRNSKPTLSTANYYMTEFPTTEKIAAGTQVTVSLKGNLGSDRTSFLVYNTTGMVQLSTLVPSDKKNGVFTKTFDWVDQRADGSNKVDSSTVRIYSTPSDGTTPSTIEWIKLEYGNKATDWSPAPEEMDEKIVEQGTKIDSATSYIEQNKSKIASSVSKTDVEGQFSKITTNQNTYSVTNTSGNVLTEFYGAKFTDNYTYEVTAKNTTMANENLASAVFVSKGANKGFTLVELENKGTTGTNPKFMLNSKGEPCISVYTASGTQKIDVIYTKYMGSGSAINTAKSLIEQKANEINLEVKRVEELTLKSNMLINSDFSNLDTGWRYLGDKSNWSFPSTDVMSINTDNNLLLASEYNNNIFGSDLYRRIEFPLASPLVAGKTYTLKFKLTCDSSIKTVNVLPYKPSGSYSTVTVNNGGMNTLTFTATSESTTLLIYTGMQGATPVTSNFTVENATLIEGDIPLEYSNGSSKGVAKYVYNNTTDNYPSLASDKMRVDKAANFTVGDVVTFSVYVYIPSTSKDILTEDLYAELAVYENTKQSGNPSIARADIIKSKFVYDTWVRYSCTATIPSTSTNGKTKYISALMRFKGGSQSPNANAVFYYALPQLEKGPNATAWTASQLDSINSEGLATKISLNPDSIEMISNNLKINTDVLSINNNSGTLTMKGDTLTISSGSNSTKITPKGLTIVNDGVEKMLDGLTYAESNVQAYEPQFASYHLGINGAKNADARYMSKPVVFPGINGLYALDWGGYNLAKSNKDLVESSGTAWARVNRYTYLHNQRYLKINLSCTTTGPIRLHLRWMDTTGGTRYHEEIITSESYTYPKPVIDLGKPDNKIKYFELQAGVTQGTANYQAGEFRITRMTMSNFKDFK